MEKPNFFAAFYVLKHEKQQRLQQHEKYHTQMVGVFVRLLNRVKTEKVFLSSFGHTSARFLRKLYESNGLTAKVSAFFFGESNGVGSVVHPKDPTLKNVSKTRNTFLMAI